MSSTKKLLSINNLKKYFPIAKSSIFQKDQLYVRANEDISIDIYEGETFGLVGESGCGKSTLGRTILQLYDQTAGSTIYYGKTLGEFAPKYVAHTLKNANAFVSMYKKANDIAQKLESECEKLGENATFYQIQSKNLAKADAETKFLNVVRIIGGFASLDDCSVGANALYEKYVIEVALSAIRRKEKDIDISLDYYKSLTAEKLSLNKNIGLINKKLSKLLAKKANIDVKVNSLSAKIEEKIAKIEELKKPYFNDEKFNEYESHLDDGIDLSRLKYSEMRLLRKDVQIIFQDPYSSLNPRMTVGQIIEEGLVTHKFFKHGSDKMKQSILQTMNNCGLQDYMLHRYPHQFSGGQRQRICIARALAVKPKFVVCDECVSALDVSIQSQIINLLEDLKEKENLTYLFISHDLSVVRYISDRIGVMYLGNIVELGTSETIFSDPRHPYTVALLSSIPTTDINDLKKERIILQGSIPSPIRPPEGCKFHTRCYMACDKCKRVPPPLVEIEKGHFVACHFLERKIDKDGNYLFKMPKMENKYLRSNEQKGKDVVVEEVK